MSNNKILQKWIRMFKWSFLIGPAFLAILIPLMILTEEITYDLVVRRFDEEPMVLLISFLVGPVFLPMLAILGAIFHYIGLFFQLEAVSNFIWSALGIIGIIIAIMVFIAAPVLSMLIIIAIILVGIFVSLNKG